MTYDDRYRYKIDDLPLPDSEADPDMYRKRHGIDLSGRWLPEDFEALTEEMPVPSFDSDVDSTLGLGQGAIPVRPEMGKHADGTPRWIPTYQRDIVPELSLGTRIKRAAIRLGGAALLLATGVVGGFGFNYVNHNMNAGHSTANVPISTPYTPTAGRTPNSTPTTKPTPNTPSPTATPNTQPPTQTPPTPTPQPPTPTPKIGPQPEYVTKSDGNLQAGDTVFATCRSGSGASETYTVGGVQYSASDFQNTNDANLPQC